jgi:hypothetical protein
MRQVLTEPQSQEEWDNLPVVFHQYLDEIDEARQDAESKEVNDPLYPSYTYSWDVDSNIPLDVIMYHWNQVDSPLPEPKVIVEEISDALGEAAYDDWVASAYSY